MSLPALTKVSEAGVSGVAALFADVVRFMGDAAYPDGGSANIQAVLRTALGRNVTPIGVIGQDCGIYEPVLTETPASVAPTATFPTADQDGNTITYKLNGAAEATLTLSGAHTTAAALVTSIDAVAGLRSYAVGATLIVKTDLTGPNASLEITGGTANAAYGFPTTVNTGSANKLLMVKTKATGADAGSKTASTDLSGTRFEMVVLSK